MTERQRGMRILLAGLLAGALGLAPHPSSGASPRAAVAKPAKDGGGRIAGAAKKDGIVTGSGRRTAGSRIGGK